MRSVFSSVIIGLLLLGLVVMFYLITSGLMVIGFYLAGYIGVWLGIAAGGLAIDRFLSWLDWIERKEIQVERR